MNIREAIAKLTILRHDLRYRNPNDPASDAIDLVLAELTELQRPDTFWVEGKDYGDWATSDMSDLFDETDVGTIVHVRRAHYLPYIWAVVCRDADGDDDSRTFATKEAAKAWKAKDFPNAEEPSE